ncbi:LacI family DNA-binding transcriptional regulator [Microbacterium sp. Root61]|uniref:LacI family DNA-binding transcriptional regulator n=1 Tax=Microbacterium sp. Root61 TaxID=1736570 RepID=UPI00138F43E0|nr:LacI family DNA-binding transcriptional regulator [Microbacterium sp. Root61]
MAARAGVSPGLVSRLLNNDASLTVRPETREAVLDAVRELDYVPNSSAASLRRNRTEAIGLVLDRVTNPVFTEVVHGAQEAAAEFGYGLLMADAEEAEEDETFLAGIIKSRRVDGLLLQGGYGPRAAMLQRYSEAIPSVIVNSTGNGAASGVRLEDDAAARVATAHLLGLGHRNVAFVTGSPGAASDARQRGYEEALTNVGLPLRPDLAIPGGWQAEDGMRAVREWLRSGRGADADAYVVGTSVAALGVLAALAEAGVRVPDDVSVVGIHDPWFAPYVTPTLTTVALPLFELGRRSILQLMTHLESGKPPEAVISDPAPRLIVRESTRQR